MQSACGQLAAAPAATLAVDALGVPDVPDDPDPARESPEPVADDPTVDGLDVVPAESPEPEDGLVPPSDARVPFVALFAVRAPARASLR